MLEKQFLNLWIIHCNLIQRPHVSNTLPSAPNNSPLNLFAFNLSAVHSHSLKKQDPPPAKKSFASARHRIHCFPSYLASHADTLLVHHAILHNERPKA